jgi:predicted HTH domain antitoxin
MYEYIYCMKMPRTTSTLPDDIHQLVEGSIKAGVFENKSDAIRHAIRQYFEEDEEARTAAAVRLYQEEEVSLGKAARLADVPRQEMPDVLREHGVEVRLGPEDMEDAEREIEAARDLNE